MEKSSTQAGGSITERYSKLNGYTEKANGTCYQNRVNITYDNLESIFGEPSISEPSSDDKVQVEWVLLFDDGRVGTIYDWKQYDTEPEDVTCWHLGGHNKIAPNRIMEIIRKQLRKKGITVWGS